MSDELRKALSQIASASPCVYRPGTPQERTCVLCETFINEARDALGFERWPAIPATPIKKQMIHSIDVSGWDNGNGGPVITKFDKQKEIK
jgi:hypothetical protein